VLPDSLIEAGGVTVDEAETAGLGLMFGVASSGRSASKQI